MSSNLHKDPVDTVVSTATSGRPSSTFAASTQAVVEHDAPASDEVDTWKPDARIWMIAAILAAVNTIIALDATVIVPALPSIATSIKANAVQSFWIGTSYLVTYAVSQPVIFSLSDHFGRLPLFLFAIISFTVGTIVAGIAHTVTQMLAGRVVQGIGGGGIFCLTQAIASDLVPLQHRPKFLSIPQLTWALGLITGPIIGGAIAEKTTWRWMFWINLPFCGLGLLAAPFVIRLRRENQLPFVEALLRLDWPGIVVFTGGVTAFLIGLSFGGEEFPWQSYHTLVPLILGAVLVVAALVFEACLAKQPFLKISMYRSHSCIGLIVAMFLQGFMMYLALYVWNVYFMGSKGHSALGVGVCLIPLMVSTMPSSIFSGLLISRTGRYKVMLLVAWALVTLGSGLVLLWQTGTPASVWAISEIILGIGHGAAMVAHPIALQSHVTAEHSGDAIAMAGFLRALGLAAGVGIGGTIFQNRLKHWLVQADLPASIALNIEAYLPTLNTLPSSQHAFAAAVRRAIAQANKNVFEVCLAISGLVLLLMIAVKEVDLKQKLVSKHVLAKNSEQVGEEKELVSIDQVTVV